MELLFHKTINIAVEKNKKYGGDGDDQKIYFYKCGNK